MDPFCEVVVPDNTDPPPAKRRRTFEFAGTGALVQLLGLIVLGGAGYLGFQVPPLGWGWFALAGNCMVWGVGLIACTALFMVGSRMAERFSCGSCGNRLEDQYTNQCPRCKATVSDNVASR